MLWHQQPHSLFGIYKKANILILSCTRLRHFRDSRAHIYSADLRFYYYYYYYYYKSTDYIIIVTLH